MLLVRMSDSYGRRMIHENWSGVSSRHSTVEVLFKEPIAVVAQRKYRIGFVFKKFGNYLLGRASPSVYASGVHFNFAPHTKLTPHFEKKRSGRIDPRPHFLFLKCLAKIKNLLFIFVLILPFVVILFYCPAHYLIKAIFLIF